MATALPVIDLQRGTFTGGAEPHDGDGLLSRVSSLQERAWRRGQTEYCIGANHRPAAGLGYEVVLAKNGHSAFDTPNLSAAQVIARHNSTLDGSFVELAAAGDVEI